MKKVYRLGATGAVAMSLIAAGTPVAQARTAPLQQRRIEFLASVLQMKPSDVAAGVVRRAYEPADHRSQS